MATPEATELTRRHRRQLAQLSDEVQTRLKALLRTVDLTDVSKWWTSVSPQAILLVQRGADAAAVLAAQYLQAHAAAEGVAGLTPTRVGADRDEIATSLEVTGPVAFKTNVALGGPAEAPVMQRAYHTMRIKTLGAATRLVLNGSRKTTMATFSDSDQVKGWRRVSGGSPCAFCAMLISRGATYSKSKRNFEAHDHDNCSAELVYREEKESPSVAILASKVQEVTAGLSGKDALAAWRDYWASGKGVPAVTGQGDATAA